MGLWTVSGHRTSLGNQRLFSEAEQCPESCQGTTGCSTAPGPGNLLHCSTRAAPSRVPRPFAAACPVAVSRSGKLHWLLLSCGTALLSWGCTEPSTKQQHVPASPEACPAAAACRRERRVHARMERVRCWGMSQVMGTNLLPQEDLNPCLCSEGQPPRCPSVPCGCCRCSCSWGSAASGHGWSPQVSGGGHGWAQVDVGASGTVLQGDVWPWAQTPQHTTCAVSPASFHAAEMTTKLPTAPWESCLGSLEPSPLLWGWQMCPVMLQSEGLSMDSCLFQNSPRPHLDLDQGPSLCSQPTPDSQMTAGQLDSQPWRAPTAAG